MKKLVFLTALLPMSSFAELALDTQKVTANKITDTRLSNSTVISKEQIELLQASNLSEVLTSLPGFQVTTQGGNANTQSFTMNGFKSGQILILLNGQRFSSATLGTTTFNTIPANIIQRIEIVSNSRSAIYGSDAMGGVINIVTTQDDTAQNNVKVALGNQETSQFSTNLNKQIGNLSLNLSGFTEKTQGFDVFDGADNDKDGSERHALGINVGYQINDENKVFVSSQTNRGSADYDNQFGGADEIDYQQQVTSLGWDYSDDTYGISAKYGESFDKSWNYGNGTSRSNADGFITETKTADVSARAKIDDSNTVLLVTDYREDDICKSSGTYTKTKTDIYGIGLSHNFSSDAVNTELGIRRDDASLFDEEFSYSASIEWFAMQQLSIIAAINTGFKTPSFNDLFSPFGGNQDLSPEESLNRRLAIQYNQGQSTFNASYQLSHIDNLIVWKPGNNGWAPENVNKALLRNAVVSWDHNWLNNFASQLSYEWNDAIDLDTHNRLARQSARVAKLNLNYTDEKYSTGTSVRYLSDSYDDAANNTSLAAYTVVDLFGNVNISNNFSVGVRVNNLTDKEYQTANNYPAQERTYLVSGSFTF